MENFVNMLLGCTISMSIISLLVYGFRLLLSKRYNSKGFYFTWIIIMAGFMIPYRPTFSFTKVQINIPGNVSALSTIDSNTLNNRVLERSSTMAYKITETSICQVIFAIWLTVFLLSIIYQVLKHWKFIRLVRRWSQDIKDENTIFLLKNLCREMKIVTPIKCRKCDCISTPMLIHFIKPVILLPEKQLTISKLTVVLKHELVHFKRKDLWIKALVVVARAIHWFNPLIYFLSKEIALQCELSCDMEVIEGLDFDTRLSYCKTIISMAGGQDEIHTPLATNFNGGKNMKKRLLGIMDPGKKKLSMVLMCVVCILILGTGAAYASGIADDPIAPKDNSSVPVNEKMSKEKSGKTNTVTETDTSQKNKIPATKETVEEQAAPNRVPTTTLEEPAEEAYILAEEEAIAAVAEAVRLAKEITASSTTTLEEQAEEACAFAEEEAIAAALEAEKITYEEGVSTTSLEEAAKIQ